MHDLINDMEDDRAEVDLGVAVDLEERLEEEVQRMPKRRFVGRRQAAEVAANGEAHTDSKGIIQGMFAPGSSRTLPIMDSFQIKENTSNVESGSS